MGYNSTIQKKHCKCSPDCDKWPTMSCFGYNYNHLPEDLKEKAGTKRKVQIKNRNKKVALSAKLHKAQRELDGDDELELWFVYVANEIRKNPRCWECNMWIPEQFYRHASAHIFPKRIFKSIQTHPMNYLILGAGCGCHHKFDSSVEAASKMKVWKIAVQSFAQFENEIKEKHKYLELFKQYL